MDVAPVPSKREGSASYDDDEPRFLIEDVLGWVVVLVCVGIVLASLHPSLLVKNTTPNGGDMGAHVWWPAFLRDHWFNHFRLAGWAPDWYAGFPVGQFYFPLPALLIDLFAIVMPYNVAFKLVTVSGSLLLPVAAYTFARSLRFPWPSPPLFALVALRYLYETRTSAITSGEDAWTIYGGNLASTLAGEFSYVLGLTLALFFLAAFSRALEQRRRLWLPAVLLAATVLCHIVIAAFAVVGALAVWLIRRPTRTWMPTIAVGAVGALITAVWSLPLLLDTPYTQSMRYEKVQTFAIHLFGFRADQHHPLLPRPPWMWALIVVAVLAAGWWRRGCTLVLMLMATVFALFFRFWPEHSVWNTRFLPLYYLCIGFLAAVGAAELMRALMKLARRAYDWVREGDRLDAIERQLQDHAIGPVEVIEPGEPAATTEPNVPTDPAAPIRVESVRVDVPVRADDTAPAETAPAETAPAETAPAETAPAGTWSYTALRGSDPENTESPAGVPATVGSAVTVWTPSVIELDEFDPVEHAWRRRIAGVITLLVLLAAVVVPTMWWVVDNEGVAPAWASWNYEGYEKKPAWPEFRDVISTMGKLPPGRALWEPSSDINNYGTTLALELLPYFTHGRIGSMEGLYFESSMTTDFHFLTVSELTATGGASNPVRGLVYGSIDDFDKGVEHLRMLGVRYFMAQSTDAKRRADTNDGLQRVATVPDRDGQKPSGWKIYEVKGWNLAEALKYEPVVVPARGGPSSRCFGTPAPGRGQHDPELAPWECAAAPWWVQGDLDRPFAADGPDQWARAKTVAAAAKVTPRPLPKVTVGPVDERVDSISFHVSRPGVPVVVKTSYFPNWKVKGARGPWRLAPNLMVVVPTKNDVKLTYGLTTGDRAGRVLTAVGLLGIVALARMRPTVDPVDPKPPAPPPGDGAAEADGPLGETGVPEPDVEVLEPGARPRDDDDEDDDEGGDEPDEEAGRPDEVPALP